MNENVLIPVGGATSGARTSCHEIGQWVEEEITYPVESWISKVEKFCRDLPWPLSWICDTVTVVVKVVEWVIETVLKWVVTIVCEVVTFAVDLIVNLLLRLIAWTVGFFVCLFTDPLEALKSFYDLWNIILDAIDDIIDFVITLLDIVVGILDDIDRLLDSIAASLGWLGILIGLIKALTGLIRRLIEIGRDGLKAIKDIVLGILSLDTCRILRGLSDLVLAGARTGLELGAVGLGYWIGGGFGALIGAGIRLGGLLAGGVRDSVQLKSMRDVIEEKIRAAFSGDDARITRALEKVNLYTRIAGLPFKADARRMYLSSRARSPDLRDLHKKNVVNLYAYAGYLSRCSRYFNEVEAEVVYAGTDLRVSYSDLDTYLADGPNSVPEFHVFPITRAKFRDNLEVGRKKARFIGVQLLYPSVDNFEIVQGDWIPLAAGENDNTVQQEIFRVHLGREPATQDLSILPAFAHFHYLPEPGAGDLFGLTAWYRPSRSEGFPSGVTFRNLSLAWLFRWVLIHEMGHYWGLNHRNRSGGDRGPDEILFAPSSGTVTFSMFYEYLLLGGEPRFTFDDVKTAWEWITGDAKDSLLP